MAKTNKQINKEYERANDEESSPAVVAYRIGQLEQTVKEGFEAHNLKLDKLVSNFADKSDVLELNRQVGVLFADVDILKRTDATQQGAIEANKRFVSVSLTLLGMVVVAISTYFGLHK